MPGWASYHSFIIILRFPFQLQDAETSDQLKCFRIITKPKRGQTQASERRVRVRLRRGGAEDWRIPHQAEKEHREERSVLWVCGTYLVKHFSLFKQSTRVGYQTSPHFLVRLLFLLIFWSSISWSTSGNLFNFKCIFYLGTVFFFNADALSSLTHLGAYKRVKTTPMNSLNHGSELFSDFCCWAQW